MQFPSPVSIEWIAEFIDAQIIGHRSGMATGINEIHKVGIGDLNITVNASTAKPVSSSSTKQWKYPMVKLCW